MKFYVSACLAGINCRYNGLSEQFFIPRLKALVDRGLAVAVCPETAGGLPVPRDPVELDRTRVPRNKEGLSFLDAFAAGNSIILKAFPPHLFRAAVLKDNSPSCGVTMVYDGSFSGRKKEGMGLFAEQLSSLGIAVYPDIRFEDFLADFAELLPPGM